MAFTLSQGPFESFHRCFLSLSSLKGPYKHLPMLGAPSVTSIFPAYVSGRGMLPFLTLMLALEKDVPAYVMYLMFFFCTI